MNIDVDTYISTQKKWTQELQILRSLLLELPLTETIKWGAPVYVYKNKNVVGIAGFKNYFGLWFFQGGLLLDEANVLQNAQEGKTKAMRQWRFSSVNEIDKELLKSYVLESLANLDQGKEIKPDRKSKKVILPKELDAIFTVNQELKKAFLKLTPSKQREYATYIEEAKREKTKITRIQKITPMILKGVGLNDKYKNC